MLVQDQPHPLTRQTAAPIMGGTLGGLKTSLAVKKTEKQCCLYCNSGQVAACALGPVYAKRLCQLITIE